MREYPVWNMRWMALGLGAAVLLIGQGCASRQQVVDLESSVAEIKANDEAMSQDVSSIKDIVQSQQDLILSSKADVLAEISNLKEQLYQMENRLSEKGGETPLEFGSQVQEGEFPTAEPAPGDQQPGKEQPGKESKPPEVGGVNERVMYDTAYLDMTRGNYDLAIEGFQTFIKSSPGSQLLDNAQYWIGECYYAKGDFRRAIEEFNKVVDNYPRGNKIPSALFKIGKCYFELGDRDSARRYFKSVVDGYPRSEEANLAKDYLSELKE